MTDFRHFILTRFNTGIYDPKTELGLPPEQWMEHRIRLFTTFTLPSIAGQSCQAFTWLVLMDSQTPEPTVRRLEELACPNMEVIFPTPGRMPWLQSFPPGRYDLITTRIDNDDAFHRDVVQTVQDAWRTHREQHPKPWVMVFPFGLIMDLPRRRAWVMEYWFNNCPTAVEGTTGPRTIWQWDHSNIPPDVPKCYIEDKAYWLQVVHGHNLRNAVRSSNPNKIVHDELEVKLDQLRHFNIDPAAVSHHPSATT